MSVDDVPSISVAAPVRVSNVGYQKKSSKEHLRTDPGKVAAGHYVDVQATVPVLKLMDGVRPETDKRDDSRYPFTAS